MPLRVRALLAVALAAADRAVGAAKAGARGRDRWSTSWCWPVAEALVGLTLGLGVLVLFSGMQVAGQIISQMSGMQLADVFDPGFDSRRAGLFAVVFLRHVGGVRHHRRPSPRDGGAARHVRLAAGGAGERFALDRPRP